MSIDLSARPRLANMRRLGGPAPVVPPPTPFEATRKPRATPASEFRNRTGYSRDFITDFQVKLPTPVGQRLDDVLAIDGTTDNQLDYEHFSVVMSKLRRIAIFVACNIDGKTSKRLERKGDKWALDGRIPPDAQIGEELYADNDLDRGHLVRREDPNWGDTAELANEDTFHFTNCSPQMAAFNQKTWLGLENYVLREARASEDRITVFGGPIFSDSDRPYRGVLVPLAYWKVIAFVNEEGLPSATAYMIDQKRELGALEATFGVYKTYQRSIRYIERISGLHFGNLASFDGFSNEELATGTHIESVLDEVEDIRV